MQPSTMKLAITLCHLLAIARNVQTSDFNSSIYMRFSDTKKIWVRFGDGVESHYLPAVEWKAIYDPFPAIEYTAYTRARDICHFTRHVSEGTMDVSLPYVHQLSNETLALVWHDQMLDRSSDVYHWKITIVDVATCSSKEVIDTEREASFVFYARSFDAIYRGTNSTRVSYDLTGRKIDEVKLPSSWGRESGFQLLPVSTKDPSQGFFHHRIVDGKRKLSLVDAGGNEVKKLVDSDKRLEQYDTVSYSNDTVRAFCWVAGNEERYKLLYECAQYDQRGNELWRNSTEFLDYAPPKYVRNLSGGGVLLVALDMSKDKLLAIEMRAQQDTVKSTHAVDGYHTKITGFDERDRSFAALMKDPESRDAYLVKYDFPSKSK